MLARVKGWVEYNRVKTNSTISQKHEISITAAKTSGGVLSLAWRPQ